MYSQFSEVKFSSVALAIAENSCQLYHIIMALKRYIQKEKKRKENRDSVPTASSKAFCCARNIAGTQLPNYLVQV